MNTTTMNTKEMIEVMQAFEDGKKIEFRYKRYKKWQSCPEPKWDWFMNEYRIAPEPEPKKEGRWERVEITITMGHYSINDMWIDQLPRVPGFGGIDYKSPFNPKLIVRSMVPVVFSPDPNSDLAFSVGIEDSDRPGIPVAAWFWREEK